MHNIISHCVARRSALVFAVVALATSCPGEPPLVPGSGDIGPAGGQVTSVDGKVTLDVPPGALSAPVRLFIEHSGDAPTGFEGLAYDIGPSGTEFDAAATVTFDIGDDFSADDAAFARVATVEGGVWVPLAAPNVDASALMASGATDHLSPFGVIRSDDPVIDVPLHPDCREGIFCGAPLNCLNCPVACGSCPDLDGDGLNDLVDNCPDTANVDQADADRDGRGDVCDGAGLGEPSGPWPLGGTQSQMQRAPFRLADAYTPVGLGETSFDDDTLFPLAGFPYYCGEAICAEPDADLCGITIVVSNEVPLVEVRRQHAVAGHDGVFVVYSLYGSDEVFRNSFGVVQLSTDAALTLVRHDTFTSGEVTDALGLSLRADADPSFDILSVTKTDAGLLLAGTLGGVPLVGDDVIGLGAPMPVLVEVSAAGIEWGAILTPVTRQAQLNTGEVGGAVVAAHFSESVSLGDGRFAMLTQDGLSVIARPSEGASTLATHIVLGTTSGLTFLPRHLATDNKGNLFVLGVDIDNPRPDVCYLSRETWMLRGYRSDLSLAWEEDLNESLTTFDALVVSSEIGPDNSARTNVRVVGIAPTSRCTDHRRHFHKDATAFSDNPDDPTACPSEFEEACQTFEGCPCTSCDFVPYDTPNLFGRGCGRDVSDAAARAAVVFSFLDVDEPFDAGPVETALTMLPGFGFVAGSRPVILPSNNDELSERMHFSMRGGFYGSGGFTPGAAPMHQPMIPRGFQSVLLDNEDEPRAYTRDGVVQEREGSAQLLSAPPREFFSIGTDTFRFLPTANERIVVHTSENGRVGTFTLLEPTTPEYPMPRPSLDEAPPVVAPCNDELSCEKLDLGLRGQDASLESEWASCVSYRRSGGGASQDCPVVEVIACDEEAMIRSLEFERTGKLTSVDSYTQYDDGTTQSRCVRGSIVRETEEVQTPNKGPECITRVERLRCAEFDEFFVPGKGAYGERQGEVVHFHDDFTIDENQCVLRPSEARVIVTDARPVEVNVENGVIAPGESTTFSVTADAIMSASLAGGAASVSGSGGTTQGGGAAISIFSGENVTVTATGPGTITIDVVVTHSDGTQETVRVNIAVDDPLTACAANDDGTFSSCSQNAPHGDGGDAETYENKLAPAIAGAGVLLHDLSLRVSTHDLTLKTLGGDLTFGRTYRSAHPHDEGGIFGGWTFAFDERLVAQHDAGSVCESNEAFDAGADIVFYDASGRGDKFVHPGTSTPEVYDGTETGEAAFYTVDHSIGSLRAEAFDADVVTYQTPPGRFETLKAYHLRPPAGQPASAVHPYYNSGTSSVRAYEQRFFVLDSEDKTRRVFNCKGQLIRMLDAQFHETELLYDGGYSQLTGAPELSAVVDSNGRTTSIEWQSHGPAGRTHRRISKLIDPFGRSVHYGYSVVGEGDAAQSRLTRVFVNMEGEDRRVEREMKYHYDESGRLVEVIGPDGRSEMRVAYDADGRVTQQELGRAREEVAQDDAPTDTVVTTFSSSGSMVTVTNGRGHNEVYTLAPTEHGAMAITALVTDAAISNGNTSTPGFATQELTTAYGYNADGAATVITYPSGRVVTYVHDDKGGVLSRTETPSAAGGQDKTTAYTYDPVCHRVLTTTAPSGRVTTSSLATWGEFTSGLRCQYADTTRAPVTGPDGTTLVTYVDTFEYVETGRNRGLLREVATTRDGDPVRTETFDYDAELAPNAPLSPAGQRPGLRLGTMTSLEVTGPLPAVCADSAPAVTTTYQNDERGNRTQMSVMRTAGALVTTYKYDMADRQIEETRGEGTVKSTKRWTYDVRGLATKYSTLVQDMFTNVAAVPPVAALHNEITVYDRLGRVLATMMDEGHGPESVNVSLHNALGQVVDQYQPGPGATDEQVVELWDAVKDGGDPAALKSLLDPSANMFDANRGPVRLLDHRDYDARGLLTARTITDGGNVRAQLAPDTLPEGEIDDDFVRRRDERFFLDAEGNVVLHDPGRTDRAGVFTVSSYDGNGRLTSVGLTDPACDSGVFLHETRYENYDLNDVAQSVRRYGSRSDTADPNAAPAVCGASELLATTSYAVDSWGRVIEEEVDVMPVAVAQNLLDSHPSPTLTHRFALDDKGRRILDVFLDRRTTVSFTPYDKQCANEEYLSADANLTPDERVRAVLETYDDGALLTARQERHEAAGSFNNIIVNTTFTHDDLGRTETATDGVGMMHRYYYDTLDRQRGVREPRGHDVYGSDDAFGVFVARTFTARGHLASETRRANTPFPAGLSDDVRTETRTYREDWLLDHDRGDGTGVRSTESFAYDLTGEAVIKYPYGRDDGRATTVVVNEMGDTLIERTPDDVVRQYVVSAAGVPLRVAAMRPDGAAPGYAQYTPSAERTFRYNGLGALTYAGVAVAATPEDPAQVPHNVVFRHDSLGRVLEEHTSTDSRTRTTYGSNGFRSALFYDDAPANDPDLTFSYDDRGMMTAIDATGGRALFSDLSRIEYDYHGDKLTERRSSAFITRYRHDERGERTGIDHYAGDTQLTDKFLTSRRFYYGLDVAATYTVPVVNGVQAGAFSGVLDALRTTDGEGGNRYAHLTQYPGGANSLGGNYALSPGAPWPAVYRLFDRSLIGDERRVDVVSYSAFEGRPSMTMTFNEREPNSYRLENVQTLAWLGNTSPDTFAAGTLTEWHHREIENQDKFSLMAPKDRIVGVTHRILQAPPTLSISTFPRPANYNGAVAFPSTRTYDMAYTHAQGLAQVGFDDADSASGQNLVIYDAFDHRAQAVDGMTDGIAAEVTGLQPRRALTQSTDWDARDRRYLERYAYTPATGAGDTPLTTERTRSFAYLGNTALSETNTLRDGVTQQRTHFVYGGVGDLPYTQTHFGGRGLFEDINGSFVASYDAASLELGGLTSAMSAETAFKAQPYIKSQTDLQADFDSSGFLGNLTAGFMTPFSSLPNGSNYFRKVSASTETNAFDGSSYTAALGYQTSFLQHPHHGHELLRLQNIALTDALVSSIILMPIMSVLGTLPAVWAKAIMFVKTLVSDIGSVIDLYKDVRRNGFSFNTVMQVAAVAQSVYGYKASVSKLLPKGPPQVKWKDPIHRVKQYRKRLWREAFPNGAPPTWTLRRTKSRWKRAVGAVTGAYGVYKKARGDYYDSVKEALHVDQITEYVERGSTFRETKEIGRALSREQHMRDLERSSLSAFVFPSNGDDSVALSSSDPLERLRAQRDNGTHAPTSAILPAVPAELAWREASRRGASPAVLGRPVANMTAAQPDPHSLRTVDLQSATPRAGGVGFGVIGAMQR